MRGKKPLPRRRPQFGSRTLARANSTPRNDTSHAILYDTKIQEI